LQNEDLNKKMECHYSLIIENSGNSRLRNVRTHGEMRESGIAMQTEESQDPGFVLEVGILLMRPNMIHPTPPLIFAPSRHIMWWRTLFQFRHGWFDHKRI
jgi:hypothetical protein